MENSRILQHFHTSIGCLFSSLKRYFLLAEGDWLELFWDSAGEDLVHKMADHIPVNRLRRLLELAVRVSVTAKDPYKDALTCELRDKTLLQTLQIFEKAKNTLNISSNDEQKIDDYTRQRSNTPAKKYSKPPTLAAIGRRLSFNQYGGSTRSLTHQRVLSASTSSAGLDSKKTGVELLHGL